MLYDATILKVLLKLLKNIPVQKRSHPASKSRNTASAGTLIAGCQSC